MAKNYRGTGSVVRIKSAAANVTAGDPKVEGGFHGVVANTASAGSAYSLHIAGEHEVPFVSSAVQGSTIYITDSSGALSLTGAVGKRIFGKVSAVPGASNTGTYLKEPATGYMWVILAHQNDAQAS
jgi:predicted RecA/RadA family phage recombinase